MKHSGPCKQLLGHLVLRLALRATAFTIRVALQDRPHTTRIATKIQKLLWRAWHSLR